MRPAFNRRLFLLAWPGTDGYGNVRPFRPGVARMTVRYAAGNRLTETLTLFCGRETGLAAGCALFAPDETAFRRPLYLIRSVTEYPDHLEAEAEAQNADGGIL